MGRQELAPVGAIGPDRRGPIIPAFPRIVRCLVCVHSAALGRNPSRAATVRERSDRPRTHNRSLTVPAP